MDEERRQKAQEAVEILAHEARKEREFLLTVVWRNGTTIEKVVGDSNIHKKVEEVQRVGLRIYRLVKAKLFWEIIPFHEIRKISMEEQ